MMNMKMNFVAVLGNKRPYRATRQRLLPFGTRVENDSISGDAVSFDRRRGAVVQPVRDERGIEQAHPAPVVRCARHVRHSLDRARGAFVNGDRPRLEMIGVEVPDLPASPAPQPIGEFVEIHGASIGMP